MKKKYFIVFTLSLFLLYYFFSSPIFALTTESNEAQTRVGNPPVSSVSSGSNVHYCQGDPQWGNVCAMAYAGCGPTSMAMVLSSFGDTITPLEMDKIFNTRGNPWRTCGDNPSYMPSAINTYLPERGYDVKMLSQGKLNLTTAKQYIDDGYLIIGSVSIHIFVIDGVNIADDTVHMRDPARCGDAGIYWTPNSAPWRGYQWYYAFAVKKK